MKTFSPFFIKAKQKLTEIRGKSLSLEERIQLVSQLAALLLQDAKSHQTASEKRVQKNLARMMKDPVGKAFTTMMTDQGFRSQKPSRIADQICYLLGTMGIPKYLSWNDRIKLKAFKLLAKIFPMLFVPVTRYFIRRETASVIMPGEERPLKRHILQRMEEGVRINLNHLGEAILSEDEALKRLQIYIDDLHQSEVEYVSIKISTIFSQINLLAWEETIEILAVRLRQLYRAAIKNKFIKNDGSSVPKFVNLDMEEYKDLHLTVELFQKVLSEPEFQNLSAGIVLQSYLPDSFLIQKNLTEWAIQRTASGGAPIKIRIVKGANLAMEQVEASLKVWPQAPYTKKIETDANFKRMIRYGCLLENAKSAHLGVASHNLFDIAFVMLLRAEAEVEQYVCFEMLEGMADHIRRTVQHLSYDMVLYCPAAKKEEFQNAVAYLIRRLDENTGPDNFLRHLFSMTPGSAEWRSQMEIFKKSCEQMETTYAGPRKTQNRFHPAKQSSSYLFENEPDTDWSLSINRQWALKIIEEWQQPYTELIPVVINGKELTNREIDYGINPSNPEKTSYRFTLGTIEDAEEALKIAVDVYESWSQSSLDMRCHLLEKIAQGIREHRGRLLGAMLIDGGKILQEGDVEVSEAIDFAEYYRIQAKENLQGSQFTFTAKGPVLITPPWNFPCSIPAGGILAALVTGNPVIFKPAPEAILVGWELAKIFWEAGVPKNILQFVTCRDDPVGSKLIQDPRISCVILTGATSTAKTFLNMRPGLDLIAETGGKNAIIITDMADRDLAIKDAIQSAFGHSGQKCSAASLLICEKAVYQDKHFLKQLKQAAASLKVGPATALNTKIVPLIRPPSQDLLKALLSLEEGEEWLLPPHQDSLNPHLWSPGIKLGVKPNSFMHQTELFGPVLAVMCAENLSHAIQLANGTAYGLTSGLHSLDEREQNYWKTHIQAGNLYINRGITGAIVQRQPFGGWKESSYGPGAKAGGPNYLFQLLNIKDSSLSEQNQSQETASLSPLVVSFKNIFLHMLSPSEQDLLESSLASYALWWNHYKIPHDPTQLVGQDNFFHLVPKEGLVFRIQEGAKIIDILRICGAALTCGAPFLVSFSDNYFTTPLEKEAIAKLAVFCPKLNFKEESEESFIASLQNRKTTRIRTLFPPSKNLLSAGTKLACHIVQGMPMVNGRFELLHYTKESTLSFDYHRYGNLITRENETRRSLVKSTQDIT